MAIYVFSNLLHFLKWNDPTDIDKPYIKTFSTLSGVRVNVLIITFSVLLLYETTAKNI